MPSISRSFNPQTFVRGAVLASVCPKGPRRAAIASVLLGLTALASAAPVVVTGRSDPYLAGMPGGSTNGSDVAPDESPVLVSGLNLTLGGQLTFTNAVGGTARGSGCSLAAPYAGCDPIDGAAFFDHNRDDENGISAVRAPISALMGVFLGLDQPSLTAAPAGLNFQTLGLDFISLAPTLKQLFFIGDGKTGTDQVQLFDVPTGATRLFLGTMDGFGWFNNTGAITLDVNQVNAPIPEPPTFALLFASIAALGWSVRRGRRAR